MSQTGISPKPAFIADSRMRRKGAGTVPLTMKPDWKPLGTSCPHPFLESALQRRDRETVSARIFHQCHHWLFRLCRNEFSTHSGLHQRDLHRSISQRDDRDPFLPPSRGSL